MGALYALIADCRLPYKLRSAALECMMAVYIDKDPHVPASTTRLARV